jgi:hypothetical protein
MDRATSLAERGLLIDAASIDAYQDGHQLDAFLKTHGYEYTWQRKLATLPYGRECSPLWDAPPGASVAVNDALTCYAISRDEKLPPLARFSALGASLIELESLSQERPPCLRLASLARVARSYGARAIAVAALSRLLETLVRERRVDLDEPFLAPGERFDTIDPGENVHDWILAAALEELEKLGSYSSYYTGEGSRRRLELIAALGYESAEMRRRLLLVQTRFPAPG